jgi:transformation/transcription domain-associated protein
MIATQMGIWLGNIRPNVISRMFCSLVSQPVRALTAAHDALRDVLTLSVVSTQGPVGTKSKSRLRKELLQTCIRPVLLNLRDYTRLNVVLLRGLEQLLSLLSSWFNRTLGEKLLDHIQKWTEPSSIRSQKIWVAGNQDGSCPSSLQIAVRPITVPTASGKMSQKIQRVCCFFLHATT